MEQTIYLRDLVEQVREVCYAAADHGVVFHIALHDGSEPSLALIKLEQLEELIVEVGEPNFYEKRVEGRSVIELQPAEGRPIEQPAPEPAVLKRNRTR